MADVPGTTLNSTPRWIAWLNQLYENQGVNRALPMFTYNGNVRPMLTPQGVSQPNMPPRANTNINPAMPPPGQYSRMPPTLPPSINSNVVSSGPLPFFAPQMVGHPTGLRDREKAILSRFEDE